MWRRAELCSRVAISRDATSALRAAFAGSSLEAESEAHKPLSQAAMKGENAERPPEELPGSWKL